jgi:hypothetical protein
MEVCNLSWQDALDDHTHPEKSVAFIPLAKILSNVQKIEDKIVAAMEKHKITISSNAKETRVLIIENASKFYRDSDDDNRNDHFTALRDFIASSTDTKEIRKKHPFKSLSDVDNQPFLCIHDLRKFLDDKFKGSHLKSEVHEKISSQETSRLNAIMDSIKAYKKMYEKFIDCIQGPATKNADGKVSAYGPKTLLKKDLSKALYKARDLTDYEENIIHEALNNIVQALLI